MKLLDLLDEMKTLQAKLGPETEVVTRVRFAGANHDHRVESVFTEERSNGRTKLILDVGYFR